MTDYSEFNDDELKGVASIDHAEPRQHKKLCSICFGQHSLTVNVGLPLKDATCDHCNRKATCYEVIR